MRHTRDRSKALVPLDSFAITSSKFTPLRLPLTFRRKQAALLNRQVFLEYKSIFSNCNVLTHGIHSILGEEHGPHLSEFSPDPCAFSIEVEIPNPESYGFAQ